MNIRKLALAPKAGFRHKEITVAEWDDAKVIIREPSAQAWLEWQEVIYPEGHENEEPLSAIERAHRNLKADVLLFIDVLFDGEERVFKKEDVDQVTAVYGPVHARIVKQALDLSISVDTAEKK